MSVDSQVSSGATSRVGNPFLASVALGITRNFRVMTSVMLLDMRTRFGRSYVSYLVAIAWPLTHLFFIIIGFMLANKIAPYGDDVYAYAASGALPYILCMYPARMMSFCLATGKPLLSFPIVKPLIVIMARAFVEMITAFVVCIIFIVIGTASGVKILPHNYGDLLIPIAASVYLGIGFGFTNVIMFSLFGSAGAVSFFILMFILYLFSGAIVPLGIVHYYFIDIIWWNPLFHLVNWLRSAYFVVYDYDPAGRFFVLAMATWMVLVGLAAERFMRGKL